ncbi:ABC transporter ATP-binding protein [Aestuariivirga sp. YIM B02566]|uniref:ABC transporter ATP-binding protein n=1 Tax=Taklimakanibacter albus TaxID=2800327 RepID=A0ACC5R7J0_9HYPH|nr:ABC transporter ATP-binding protein [Aestuariivirga sp. YIM B02566]MBK1868476.1 ABC transporter ATP-binding protein [Aestuariivirga sp. YIM B02566]
MTSVPPMPPQANDVVVEVKDLSTWFDTGKQVIKAVESLNLTLRRGRTHCIVGESGSGKSITARSILNIVPKPGRIMKGQVLLHGAGTGRDVIDLAALDPKGRQIRSVRGRDISMIFQEPMSSLSPVHTIGQQIMETIQLHRRIGKKEARERAIEVLAQVKIPRPERSIDAYPFEFSGGMRQRAMTAMALICEPKLVIADEPTTALDVTTQAEILDLMKGLQQRHGMALMFITHDMGVVAEIADDVTVMYMGEVVEHGPVNDIFFAPKHPYTQRLLASVRALERRSHRAGPAPKLSNDDAILEVSNVSMNFEARRRFFSRTPKEPPVKALDDVSFTLKRGEVLGIVGESGSGKTTLGRCVLRVLDPSSGRIVFKGRDAEPVDLAALPKSAVKPYWRKMRMIFQDPFSSLNPRMTVFQVIAEPLLNHGMTDRRALETEVAGLLERVGLPREAMWRYPHAFSGGQRQRIGIARTIALRPELIVADEATSALDVSLRAHMLDLLLGLCREFDMSFIFIGHDIGVIRYMCDRVAVMHRGRIVEIGDTDTVCDRPSHAYTRSLISAIPKPDPRLRGKTQRIRYASEVEG